MTVRRTRTSAAAIVLLAGVGQMVAAANEQRGHIEAAPSPDMVIDAIVGARYVVFLAGLAAVMAVGGLLRGERNARWLAIAAGLISIARNPTRMTAIEVICVGIFVAALLVLGVNRRSFMVRSGASGAGPGLALLLGGLAGVYAYGTVGLYVLDWNFSGATTLWQSASEAARLLFLLPTSTVRPAIGHGRWFIDSVRYGSTIVVLLGVSRLVAAAVHAPSRHDADTVCALREQWGSNALAPFCTLAGTRWHITADRTAFVAYKVVGTTAVALGESVGEPQACVRAVHEFVQLCEANGWTVGFHQVTAAGQESFAQAGLQLRKIGEEAIVAVQQWSLESAAEQVAPVRGAPRGARRVPSWSSWISRSTTRRWRTCRTSPTAGSAAVHIANARSRSVSSTPTTSGARSCSPCVTPRPAESVPSPTSSRVTARASATST